LRVGDKPSDGRREIDLEQALERKDFSHEEKNSKGREKHTAGGLEGEEEGNQKVFPPPQACSVEEISEREERFFFRKLSW
jgi:hypothetical protein